MQTCKRNSDVLVQIFMTEVTVNISLEKILRNCLRPNFREEIMFKMNTNETKPKQIQLSQNC